jgi:RNA polymerase subunit RPABC4/transcription elongation factor Spt4
MGALDEASFAKLIGGCAKCDAKAFEVHSYIDRQTSVMFGERNDDGRWTHDGEKFIDGVYRIECIRCRDVAFETKDCPRCHREGGLADAIGKPSRLAAPKRCPKCKGTEMTTIGFAPATVRTGEGRPPSPTPAAIVGDPGFHVADVMCDGCDWVARADGCPLCGGPGPLRDRP